MPGAALLTLLIAAGGLGLYLALPGGRFSRRGAALVALAGAGAVLIAVLTPQLVGLETRGWFVIFSLLGLLAAIRVITHRRPVYSALYFMLVIIAVAGLLVVMQARFLAVALVIIYAGAILVTYVFVIMLAQQGGAAPYDRQAREPFFGCLAGFVLLGLTAGRLFAPPAETSNQLAGQAGAIGTVEHVGTHLLTQYAVGLELAGVLLLAAMIGAIVIARRRVSQFTGEEGD